MNIPQELTIKSQHNEISVQKKLNTTELSVQEETEVEPSGQIEEATKSTQRSRRKNRGR